MIFNPMWCMEPTLLAIKGTALFSVLIFIRILFFVAIMFATFFRREKLRSWPHSSRGLKGPSGGEGCSWVPAMLGICFSCNVKQSALEVSSVFVSKATLCRICLEYIYIYISKQACNYCVETLQVAHCKWLLCLRCWPAWHRPKRKISYRSAFRCMGCRTF